MVIERFRNWSILHEMIVPPEAEWCSRSGAAAVGAELAGDGERLMTELFGDRFQRLGRVCCIDGWRARAGGQDASSPWSSTFAAVRIRRVPVPAGCDHGGGALVSAVRLSYRDVEELLAERGVDVDHVTIFRWVQRFTPLLIDAARPCRHVPGDRWFVDETLKGPRSSGQRTH